ncbi:hypothetical protein llap_12365 [Limosa lapponica baueri]|uniref:Uncharacterized protein n=1 Tax=Limosa lapponica baueri TaxID=1758121 RepID=A0A2I0TU63_LIMLA|nr:hypothetical protein llap_12365 [Limosa lapponica baueri]
MKGQVTMGTKFCQGSFGETFIFKLPARSHIDYEKERREEKRREEKRREEKRREEKRREEREKRISFGRDLQ